MKYLLFEKSAVERFVSRTGFQSVEFQLGMELVDTICGRMQPDALDSICVKYQKDEGAFQIKARRRCPHP